MKVRIALFGALREVDASGFIELDAPESCTVATLRELLHVYVRDHASHISAGLVQRSAFASADEILHNHRNVPTDGELAVLPPVSGG